MVLAVENMQATDVETYVWEERTSWGEGHTALGIFELESMVLAHGNTLAAGVDTYGYARQVDGSLWDAVSELDGILHL